MQYNLRKLYIITTSDLPNHVILGHASFAKNAGFDPVFIFPDRGNGDQYDLAYSDYECIKLKSFFNVNNYLSYLISLIKLFLEVSYFFSKRNKIEHVLAVDFECTIICTFLKLKKYKIYSLVNDNFAIRYKFPKFFYWVIKNFEALAYKYISDICIFPDQCRVDLLGKIKPKILYIIPNILDSDIGEISYRGNKSSNLIILMCGWLESTRGFDILLDILRKTNEKIIFILAGSGNYLKEFPELKDHDRIVYKGMLSRVENLKLMSSVDINFCFYNPNIIINRYALPQKVSDSILIKCPIYINSEVEMSTKLLENGVALTSPYFDIIDISQKLNALLKEKNHLMRMSKKMEEFQSKSPSYDQIKTSAIQMYRNVIFTKDEITY